MPTWDWPPTVSGLEAWWIVVGIVGLMASAYDIERSAREVGHHWLPSERAERGIAWFGMVKSIVLGFSSMVNMLVGIIVGLLPQSARAPDVAILIADVIAGCFLLVQLGIVVVIFIRDAERWFVSLFVWEVRERTPDDPPLHAPPIPAVPEDGDLGG